MSQDVTADLVALYMGDTHTQKPTQVCSSPESICSFTARLN